MNITKEEIDTHVRMLLEQNFDCDTGILTEGTNLFETYDLDSIDAVDLIVDVQKKYNISLSPEDFKEIRNYGDLLDTIAKTIAAAN